MYLGMHSTTIEPALDTCYLGSGKALPPRDRFSCSKEILAIFPTREAAQEYEIQLIDKTGAVASASYYNLRRKTFDKHGSVLSDAHKEICRQNSTGQCRIAWGKKYSGAGRTPAQIAGSKRAGEKIAGSKNPAKGSPGTKNQGFTPWYYITPTGNYVEVLGTTKQELASELGFTYRQLGHGFHYSNEHLKAKTLPRKGWTFGNLPRPMNLVED